MLNLPVKNGDGINIGKGIHLSIYMGRGHVRVFFSGIKIQDKAFTLVHKKNAEGKPVEFDPMKVNDEISVLVTDARPDSNKATVGIDAPENIKISRETVVIQDARMRKRFAKSRASFGGELAAA